jgi:hypothetical protein
MFYYERQGGYLKRRPVHVLHRFTTCIARSLDSVSVTCYSTRAQDCACRTCIPVSERSPVSPTSNRNSYQCRSFRVSSVPLQFTFKIIDPTNQTKLARDAARNDDSGVFLSQAITTHDACAKQRRHAMLCCQLSELQRTQKQEEISQKRPEQPTLAVTCIKPADAQLRWSRSRSASPSLIRAVPHFGTR